MGGMLLRNEQSNQKVKSTQISRVSTYIKPLLVQIANSLLHSKKHSEITERYKCIKARRGYKKAIIAVCGMLHALRFIHIFVRRKCLKAQYFQWIHNVIGVSCV